MADSPDNSPSPEQTGQGSAERSSLAGLWEQARPAVFAYVLGSVQDYHQAEDIVQEVAIAAATDFAKFDQERSFLAWATGIARLRILEFYRRRKKDRAVLSEATLVALAGAVEDLRRDHLDDQRAALAECLQKLDPRRRHAIELRYAENLRIAQIGERLEATATAAKVLLHRARVALAECVERRLAAMEGIAR